MPRQYTFKTTKDTAWLEEHLNKMGRLQRSEFIRDCIASRISNPRYVPPVSLTPAEFTPPRPAPHRVAPKNVVAENAPPVMTEVNVEASPEDLEKRLEGLYD